MTMQIGEKAPTFTLPTKTAEGIELVHLEDYLDQSPLVLLFIPFAFTGVCTEELCSVSNSLNTYSNLEAKVVAISGDSPFAQEAWAQKEGITLPLLSDYDHRVTHDYHVAYETFAPEANLPMSGVAKRSAFIIDKAGMIQYTEILDNPKEIPNFEAIQKKLEELHHALR